MEERRFDDFFIRRYTPLAEVTTSGKTSRENRLENGRDEDALAAGDLYGIRGGRFNEPGSTGTDIFIDTIDVASEITATNYNCNANRSKRPRWTD